MLDKRLYKIALTCYNHCMIQKSWWDYFDEDPYEKVGRYVPDAFGKPMIVILARISWAYLDWLEEVEKCDISGFFQDNDRDRWEEDGTIHEVMEGAVRLSYLRREKLGYPRPEWCPPASPAEYMDI